MRHDIHKSHAPRHDFRVQQQEQFEFSRNWKKEYLRKNIWLCDVPVEYIADKFNVYGLQDEFSCFGLCCDIILGNTPPATLPMNTAKSLQQQLPQVYGMIHSRYIISPDGLKSMKQKYDQEIFGTCPRLMCNSEPVLPIGLSSHIGKQKVKVFCPVCREIYEARPKVDLDGAYFGPNMAHILIDEYRLAKRRKGYSTLQHTAFGFRIRTKNFSQDDFNDDQSSSRSRTK